MKGLEFRGLGFRVGQEVGGLRICWMGSLGYGEFRVWRLRFGRVSGSEKGT